MIVATGYTSREYAESFHEQAEPIRLPGAGGWILRRPIPGNADEYDATGCYPLLCVDDWTKLEPDLNGLEKSAIAFSAVIDPFASVGPDELARLFPDVFRPFKEHFVVDLAGDWRQSAHRDHLRKARRALKNVEVHEISPATTALDEWCALYGTLKQRHAIRGPADFSRAAFRSQLAAPGILALAARRGPDLVGMVLWYRQGDVAYYHLAAYTELGYELGASFALFDRGLDRLRSLGTRWGAIGAAAGLDPKQSDGLTRFKRGWTSTTRTAYFAGRIFDRAKYEALSAGRRASDFFPAYRFTAAPG